MDFESIKSRGKARVVPAASVAGWWCVVDGSLVIDMVPDLPAARICCRNYNGSESCTEICATRCVGAPQNPEQCQDGL